MIGAPVIGLGEAFARPASVSSLVPPNPAEPATAADYVSTMRLGNQAGDFLEMAYEPAGLPNAVGAADFDRMRIEARLDHIRIPANCAARANVDGLISEAFLVKLDQQIALTLARFERVIIDPLHHYLQWKGEHAYETAYDDYKRVAVLTADQHAVRATAMWRQLAERYKNQSTRLSFDLFNEPAQGTLLPNYPPGLTAAQLNAWHVQVIAAIRATGGNNTRRMIWLEPWGGSLEGLTIPPNAGNIGVSPHCYSPYEFTHAAEGLTGGAMSTFQEDIRYYQRWGAERGVPIWIGETGVSRYINGNSATPRPAAERAEFTAFIRETGLRNIVPMCYWGYNSSFAQFDQRAGIWMPGMLQAMTALPAPVQFRPVPVFQPVTGGRIAQGFNPAAVWPGFSYDPDTGVLTARANDTGVDQRLQIVLPAVEVGGNQRWRVRATSFRGLWRIGNAPFFRDPSARNSDGVYGVDRYAVDTDGIVNYPYFQQRAPSGYAQVYRPLSSPGTFLAVDVLLLVGSPAASITFGYLRDA